MGVKKTVNKVTIAQMILNFDGNAADKYYFKIHAPHKITLATCSSDIDTL